MGNTNIGSTKRVNTNKASKKAKSNNKAEPGKSKIEKSISRSTNKSKNRGDSSFHGEPKVKKSKNGNGDNTLGFVPQRKSKKAKIKDRKSKGREVIDSQTKSKNTFDILDNEKDVKNSAIREHKVNSNDKSDDDEDDDDEIIEVSEASDSDAETTGSMNENQKIVNPDKDIVLDDNDNSDGSEIVELPSNSDDEELQPPRKMQKTEQSSMNDDFIAFDFSADEDEDDIQNDDEGNETNDEYSDENEYLSNDEGSYHSTNIKHKAGQINDEFPWIRNSDHSKEREISDWLTSEIKDFLNYIAPSAEEIQSRNNLVENLKSHIKSIWPDAELHCFGSFATDLYLPGSDIDCVVTSKRRRYDNKSSLYQLTSYIRNHGLGVEVTPIAKAKVPIIKFVDPKTRIHIDISFERSNGLDAAKLIIKWLKTTPGLRELVLIVKQFLAVRKLNEVHVGGLGGFSIICLCYSFLKLHPRLSTNDIDAQENIGCLLIEFFELYGYNFGYDKVALAFASETEPIYVSKSSNPDLMGRNPFSLAIQDPHDPSNNISRGSFNLRDIKRAFGGAFELLVNRCYDLHHATYKERLGQSILGGIIKYKGKQRDFNDARGSIKNVAFHAANNDARKPLLKKTGVLPPLPTEKAGIDPSEYYISDSFYSEDEHEADDRGKFEKIFENSQKSKNNKATQQKAQDFLDIKDSGEDEDEAYTPQIETKKEPDFSDSDDDYDPSKDSSSNPSAVSAVQKRDFWAKKAGF